MAVTLPEYRAAKRKRPEHSIAHTIEFLFTILLVCVGIFLFATGPGRGFMYRLTHREEFLQMVLRHHVHAGDHRARIAKLLGTGKMIPNELLYKGVRERADKFPEKLPHNVELNDLFVSYDYGNEGFGIVLQFRDDLLINFDPNDFEFSQPLLAPLPGLPTEGTPATSQAAETKPSSAAQNTDKSPKPQRPVTRTQGYNRTPGAIPENNPKRALPPRPCRKRRSCSG